ncbi:MAG TPA: restriction endonuclease subunit S [Spirochaetota bacterium]|nr:restriction endonuclease subunit S [Spirochaetota bacterium]
MKHNWEIKKLGEVLNLEYGKPLPDEKRKPDGLYPVYGANGEKDRTDYYFHDKKSIIVGRKGSAGEINLTEARFWPLDVTYFVTFNEKEYNLQFLYHLLSKQNLPKLAKGVKPGINRNEVYSIEITIPPLSEQKRIVAILDEVFAGIKKAKENAERNLANAKEVFESYLNGVFANPGEDWEIKTLGDIGKPSMCKRILKHQTSISGEIPFYKIGTFGKTPDAFISKEIYNEYRTKYSFPKKGDILISASGTIGRRVRYDGEPAFFQDSNIVWIDNDEKQVLNDYLYVFYEFCNWKPSKGATISRLYNSDLTSIKIVYPKSIEEQKNILKKINELSTETKRLEGIYRKKIEALEEMKKAVLEKAFRGEM